LDLIDSYDDESMKRSLVHTSLTHDVDKNNRTNISFTKRNFANAYTQAIFDHWKLSVSFISRLFKRLSCSLSGFIGEGEYETLDIKDRLAGASLGFIYELSENIKAKLTYTYSDLGSTTGSREYTKNKILLGLTIKF